MKVTFLGTGTSQGVPVITCECAVCLSTDYRDKRLRSSIWIQTDDLNIIVDAGPDFRQQMLRAKVPDIDAILITHEHKDHIAGLDDVRAYNFRFQKAIDIYSTPQVQEALKRDFSYVFSGENYPGVPKMELIDLDGDFKIKDLPVKVVNYWHYKLPVKGFVIHKVAYITDIKSIDALEKEKLKGLEVLIISALRIGDHISHLNLAEALAMIDELKPKKAYLTHLSHLMGKHEVVLEKLPSHVSVAYDTLSIEL